MVLAPALVLVGLHLATNAGYGIFRDEYYYLACAKRLAWGYVDHPPLSIAVLAAWTAAFGDGMWSIRVLPTMSGGAVVVIAALIAAELGGRRSAQVLAAIAAGIAGVTAVRSGFYSMNAFDVLFWASRGGCSRDCCAPASRASGHVSGPRWVWA
jgi:dolichyl-phosphate-mannose--protein O-mannosyl transferase